MMNKIFFRLLSLYLVVAMIVLSLPAQAWAMFIPAPAGQTAVARKIDLANIQKILESTMIKQRLIDFGLSPEEAMARINQLSDEQVHQFATKLDSLQAGGDGLGLLIFILAVAIVFIVVMEATGHHIIIRK